MVWNCDPDDNYHPRGWRWAHCLGDEEECITVEFRGADITGTKAVLGVYRSWVSGVDVIMRRIGEVESYTGKKTKWTVEVLGIFGVDLTASAKVGICYEELPEPCPDPTVSITEVSNYNPESGEVVNFTGYASGGTGHSIVSRKWDFGDGTSSTLSNPSKSWKNTTGSPKSYTVVFTATNDCGKSKSTTTTITVASEVVKTGIEIQFPSSLNGKQLIAHGAISTVLDLWWTGPAVHGGLWTKGRATWDNIDSSKKYHISVGDACKESPPIDDVYPEYPDLCAGTFGDGDDVVILVRNPGFDFRVYGSGNVHTLSGTSFNVLYLDETSGDIITTAFTGKVCGWLGIPSGTECDAFWAEFYDPIFVANYMSIASTGEDMFGNPRTLSWIDHVAFVASLVGSLPIFNLFPFAGVVKQTLGAITDIMRKVPTLVGDDLVKAGKALADICENSPDTLLGMSKSELDELRAALVKAYGDLEGNRIIDDALAACRWFVRKYHDILDGFRTGTIDDVPVETINEILDHGKTAPNDILDLMDSFSPDELSGLISKLQDGTHKHPTGTMFESVGNYRGSVSPGDIPKYVTDSCDIAAEAMKAPNPAAAADIPKSAQDYAAAGKIIEEVGENVGDEMVSATSEFAGKSHTAWKATGKAWQQAFSKKCWGIWNGLSAFYKKEKLYIMMGLALSFATTVLLGLYKYTADDTSEQATTSLSLALFTKSLERFFWPCKNASDEGRWTDLEAAIELYAADIDDAEAALARHETVQKANGTYDDFYACLMMHKFNLGGFRHDLDMATKRGTLRVTSNRNEFYAQLDETGDPVYSWKTMEVIFHHVPVGSHSAFIMKAGYTSCTTPSGTVTAGEITTVHCDLVEEVCVPAVPSITAPGKAKAKESVSFKGSATTESTITRWYWDFGSGEESYIQNPTCIYWNPGTYLVQLFVTDDCGTVTTTHTIVIEEEVCTSPVPSITAPSKATEKEAVQFKGSATTESAITWWSWDFGDGGKSTIQNPSHTYFNQGIFLVQLTVTDDCGTATVTHTIESEEKPYVPPEEKTATVYVFMPIDAETGEPLVWQDNPEVYVDGQYTRKAPGSISFGGFNEPEVKGCTLMVRATGYQNKSEWFDLKDKDSLEWKPYMDPEGYVPPVGHPIDFYIPENASLIVTPITTVSRIVAGMKRIGRQ